MSCPRRPSKRFFFTLSHTAAVELISAAKWHGKTPGGLVRLLVKQFMADRRKASPIVGLPAELAVLAEIRLGILNEWANARQQARSTFVQTDTRFLRHLLQHRGLKLSRRTLYSWKRQYKNRGPAGLIDHRRWKPNARPVSYSRPANADSAIEARSNGV